MISIEPNSYKEGVLFITPKSLRNKFLLKRSVVLLTVGIGIFMTVIGIKKLKT